MGSHDDISGPVGLVSGPGGVTAPYYIIPFTQDGAYRGGAETRAKLLHDAEKATDIFVFVHGLNTYWDKADDKFRRFIDQYVAVRAKHWPAPEREYRPILVGVFWPSTYVTPPWEAPPNVWFAPVASRLPEQDAAKLLELVSDEHVTPDRAFDIANLMLPAVETDEPSAPKPTPQDLVDTWGELERQAHVSHVAKEDFAPYPRYFGLRNGLHLLIPTMKNRAGRVGGIGVSQLLRELRRSNQLARIHGIGHSYGCKALLSALCAPGDEDAVTVDSALLLQAAVSCYCFGDCEGPDKYERAPQRCRQPIVCTYTSRDTVLERRIH